MGVGWEEIGSRMIKESGVPKGPRASTPIDGEYNLHLWVLLITKFEFV